MPRAHRKNRKRATVKTKRRPALSLIKRFPSSGLPNSVLMKHKYVDSYSVSTTTSCNAQIYRLNSMFDPYYTGVGHQPFYYDQMTPLYNRCIVYGVKVEIKASCGTNQSVIGFKTQADTSAIASVSLALEKADVKYGLCNAGGQAIYLSRYYDINKLFGVSKQMVMNGEMDFSHDSANNPSRIWYLQIFAQHPDESTTSTSQYTVELTYYAKWIDRITQSQS